MTVLAVTFGAGLAIGQSLNDNPDPGGTNTSIRTLKPLAVPQTPETVTVTVGG